jgi:hypothetical protein
MYKKIPARKLYEYAEKELGFQHCVLFSDYDVSIYEYNSLAILIPPTVTGCRYYNYSGLNDKVVISCSGELFKDNDEITIIFDKYQQNKCSTIPHYCQPYVEHFDNFLRKKRNTFYCSLDCFLSWLEIQNLL